MKYIKRRAKLERKRENEKKKLVVQEAKIDGDDNSEAKKPRTGDIRVTFQLVCNGNRYAQSSETRRYTKYNNALFKAQLCSDLCLPVFAYHFSSSNDSHYVHKAKRGMGGLIGHPTHHHHSD
jgi:hypothetical protein